MSAPLQPSRNQRPLIRLAALCLAALLAACQTSPESTAPETIQIGPESALGTTYTVKIVAPPLTETRRRELAADIRKSIDRVDRLMSTYRPDSELSRLNQHRDKTPFPVSPETFLVLEKSLEVSRLSDGAFDMTVGPLVDAWGFGPPGQPPEPPADALIEQLQKSIGWQKVKLAADGRGVLKLSPDIAIDLSAIAKGYAVDLVSETLSAAGYVQHMVEIGGEVRARGNSPAGRAWRIGVERPSGGSARAIQRVVALDDIAMATSGDYRNYYEKQGERISHEIDPRTGRPIGHRLASVTVVDPKCMSADAWATALMVLGDERGPETAERSGIAALFLVRNAEESFEERTTPQFDEFTARAAEKAKETNQP